MERNVMIYQPNSNQLAEHITRGTIEPEISFYTRVYTGTTNQKVQDQDLVFNLKKQSATKLPKPLGFGDIVQINDRAYLILPAYYKRLWTWDTTGDVAVSS